MYQLDPAEYARAEGVLQTLGQHLAVRAILAREVPGARVFVDDRLRPQVALAWSKNHLYLAGNAGDATFNSDVQALLAGVICPERRAAGSEMFELFYAPFSPGSPWEGVIEQLLGARAPARDGRQYYACTTRPPDGWRDALPPGFTLRPVDRQLLREEGLENLGYLESEMCSERATVEDFLARSFGFCLVHAGEIVSWCLSEYNLGTCCEVGIETVAAYRRRGLATLAARALVEHALSHGYTEVGWDCWADNRPSAASALRAGFRKLADYPVYWGRYEAAGG